MRKYVLFGAGKMGLKALRFFGKERVKCFCDNNFQENGGMIGDVPVIPAEQLKSVISEDTVVVITTVKPQNVLDISKQLVEMNVDYEVFEEATRPIIEQEKKAYRKHNNRRSFDICDDKDYFISWDRGDQAGNINSYFWQDLWASKLIFKNHPQVHYDIGSRIDGFIAHLLSFGQRVVQIDIRPMDINIDGFGFVQADATNLNEIEDNSLESLSALCSLEHFGLGRYGDPIDPEACFKCFYAIQKKMKKDGLFYISVPIGKECLCFNAHRVFYIETILNEFKDMEIVEMMTCFQDEYGRVDDIHAFDEWFDHEGDRMGLFCFRKR